MFALILMNALLLAVLSVLAVTVLGYAVHRHPALVAPLTVALGGATLLATMASVAVTVATGAH
ncbi:hypothetical protein ACFW4X_25915 [Streptomyces smyrnaeus]|uniref:hypothetical protein n=1 Tax=Streptomyces smyrnaeus TaxID=1387713 RepID=UPI0033CE6E17